MKKIVIGILCCFLIIVSSNAQDKKISIWKSLEQVDYKVTKDEYGDAYIPVFNEEAKKLAGTEVVVDGFIIPLEGMFKPTQLILSYLPVSECFFCGSGGPESVMEITMKEKIKYTAKRIKIRGKLKLNSDDPDKLMYLLEDGVFEGLADGAY